MGRESREIKAKQLAIKGKLDTLRIFSIYFDQFFLFVAENFGKKLYMFCGI